MSRINKENVARLSQPRPPKIRADATLAAKEQLALEKERRCAIDLANALFEIAMRLIRENTRYQEMTLYAPSEVPEPKLGEIDRQLKINEKRLPSYYRWRASAQKEALSIRATAARVEVFIIPRDDVPLRAYGEFGQRCEATLDQDPAVSGAWRYAGHQVDAAQLIELMRGWFEKLLSTTEATEAAAKKAASDPALSHNHQAKTTLPTIEKQNLVFRLLNQQEALKNDVARELHDTVIADLMTLKRDLSDAKALSREQMCGAIQQVIDRLRDICGEFAPRLQDWGLEIGIEALLERAEQQGKLDCLLNCDDDLPNLPDLVELNIFRIIQECLNNVVKYACASRVIVTVKQSEDGTLTCCVQDNGVGFDPSTKVRIGSSGLGLSSMRDRVEVIRAFCPASIAIQSTPGTGTTVLLTLNLH